MIDGGTKWQPVQFPLPNQTTAEFWIMLQKMESCLPQQKNLLIMLQHVRVKAADYCWSLFHHRMIRRVKEAPFTFWIENEGIPLTFPNTPLFDMGLTVKLLQF